MKQYNRILDYIIDQSDKYDIKNLQGEEDVIFILRKRKSLLDTSIMSLIKIDINTPLQINIFMKSVINIFTRYYNGIASILDNSIQDYYERGYKQMEDLIQLGNEISNKLSEPVKELKYGHYDEYTIEFVRKHAMELAKGYSDGKISQIRAAISNLMLQGKANKATVRSTTQKDT